ncbi:hypothetical protein LCGC14_1537490 [marine sediment metagenome]|uniref:Uncharacterized protein n=1 Tax=marine sediment metagenome TaxID=412755 RepID=A0A0F9L9Y8_9ZZZZ
MVSVLSKIKSLLGRNGDGLDFEAIRATADLEAELAKAKRAGADTWKPPTPTLDMKLACLKRCYHLVKQGSPGLELEGEELLQLEPSDLTGEDMNKWYWGLRGEAAGCFLKIINSSYSKAEVARRQREQGLEDIWQILDPGTKECCEDVLKYLSN